MIDRTKGSTETVGLGAVRVELARAHVLDHTLAQRAEGIGTHGKLNIASCHVVESLMRVRRVSQRNHAAATTSRHACMAEALKARCVLADVRWRWTLKVL